MLGTRAMGAAGVGLLGVCAALALAGCASIEPAATVDGRAVGAPFLVRAQAASVEGAISGVVSEAAEQLEDGGAAQDEVDRAQADVAAPVGVFDAAVLQSAIGTDLMRQELADRGEKVTTADVSRARGRVEADPELGADLEVPDELVEAAVEAQAVQIALSRVLDEDPEADAPGADAAVAWLAAALRTADVQVDPSFGTWDADVGTVVPPGGVAGDAPYDLFRPELALTSS